MAKTSYLSNSDDGFAHQLQTFASAVGAYAAGLGVTPVGPGIEVRFRALVKQIRASADYNESIGQTLGIEGTPQVGPDYSTLAPTLGLSTSGGKVNIDWGWQGCSAFLDQCELQVDRGDGKGMVLLAIDTTPGYTDTQGFPNAPAKWSHQAIYRVDDNRVGPIEQPGAHHGWRGLARMSWPGGWQAR